MKSATKSPPASNAKDNPISQSNSSELTSLGPDKVHTLTARATSTTVSKGTLSVQRKRELSESSVNSSTKRGKRERQRRKRARVRLCLMTPQTGHQLTRVRQSSQRARPPHLQ